MTGGRHVRVLLLALLLASVSAAAAYVLVAKSTPPPAEVVAAPPVAGEPVLVTARAITAGETLTEDSVEFAYVPAEAKEDRVLTEAAQAVGRAALAPMPKGEQILASSIGAAPAPAPSTFARDVPVGMRAISIVLEEAVGVGGFVQPGDRVDVIAGMELKPVRPATSLTDALGGSTSDGDPFPMAELILQDVEVLAIGQVLDPESPAPLSQDESEQAAAQPAGLAARPEASSATLLVTPAEALRLLLAVEAEATFRLLLRSPGDATTTELPPALITSGPLPMQPFTLVGGNLVEEGLVIEEARFRETSVPAGGTLEFEATVRNATSRIIAAGTGGVTSGHVYPRQDTWQSADDPAQDGAYTLGVTSDQATGQTYPWRWRLKDDLAPGATATITGGIQAPNTPGVSRWWFGTMLQPGTILADGVAPATITVEPITALIVTANAISLRESPWGSAPEVMPLAAGTRAEVLAYQDGWFQVRVQGKDGWIGEAFVRNAALAEDGTARSPETMREEGSS